MKRYITPVILLAAFALLIAPAASPTSARTSGPVNGVQAHFVGGTGEFRAGTPHALQSTTLACPAGWQLESGGFSVETDNQNFLLVGSNPGPPNPTQGQQPTTWIISGYDRDANPHAAPMTFKLFVGCLRTV